jgi:intron-binding protein aquarius
MDQAKVCFNYELSDVEYHLNIMPEDLIYCERFLEFLTDLESQLPTRRYVNTLVQDLNLLTLIRNSSLFYVEDNGLLRDLFFLLHHFVYFSVDDITGIQHSQLQSDELHYAKLARLQRTALRDFRSQLTILALSNYGAIEKRQELEGHFGQLSDSELESLCKLLCIRASYPAVAKVSVNRELLLDILVSFHERKRTFRENLRRSTVLPTEKTIYEPSLLRNESYNGSRSLAIPKLNLQYLSVGDFLWRSFILYRCESFFAIRQSMEDTIKRLQPRATGSSDIIQFDGFSRMAIPISKPAWVLSGFHQCEALLMMTIEL